MKEVIRYKTDDGALFETKEEAVKYEQQLEEKEKLMELIEEYSNDNNVVIDAQEMYDFIDIKRIQLIKILTNK